MAPGENESEPTNSDATNANAAQAQTGDRPYPIGGSGERIGSASVYLTDKPGVSPYDDVVIGDQLAYCYYRAEDKVDVPLRCDAWPYHRIDRIEQVDSKRLADER